MKKIIKKIGICLLSIANCLSVASCDFLSDISINFDSVLSGAGQIIGDMTDKFDSWWETESKDLESWWENASEEIEIWTNQALEKGEGFAEVADKKFHEISSYLIEKKDETIDYLVTSLAKNIHDNANKNEGVKLPKSNKTFFNSSLIDNENIDLSYDEETFIYKLVISMLPASYEGFPGILINEYGEEIIGIGYTNYSSLYMSDEGEKYYCSGFMSLNNELGLTEDDLDKKLLIRRLDHENLEDTNFVLSYFPESYKTHVVCLDKYFIFGVNGQGIIEYTMKPYNYSDVDISLGELYSFDENKIITTNTHYDSYFSSSDFIKEIKYANRSIDEIKSSIYEHLDSDCLDFSSINIENIFNQVKIKIMNLLGSDFSDITLNDVFKTDIFSPIAPSDANEFEKWIIGISSILVCVLTIVVSLFVPQFVTIMGALAGSAVEVFVQIIIDNRSVKSLDFRKVLIACVAGAISSKLNLVGDSFVAGITEACYSLIEGLTFTDAFQSFFYGALTGLALGAAFSFLGKILKAGIDIISPSLTKNIASFIGSNQVYFGNKSTKIVTDADLLNAGYSCQRKGWLSEPLSTSYNTQVLKNAEWQLPSIDNKNFRYLDDSGNIVANKVKNGCLEITDNADERIFSRAINFETGKKINYFIIDNYKPQFDRLKPATVKIDDLTMVRYNKIDPITGENILGNFQKADKALADLWSLDPSNIPDQYLDYLYFIGKNFDDLYNLTSQDILKLRQEYKFTWHEKNIKGIMQLVPSELHNAIGHSGAIADLKLAQLYAIKEIPLKGYITIYVREFVK